MLSLTVGSTVLTFWQSVAVILLLPIAVGLILFAVYLVCKLIGYVFGEKCAKCKYRNGYDNSACIDMISNLRQRYTIYKETAERQEKMIELLKEHLPEKYKNDEEYFERLLVDRSFEKEIDTVLKEQGQQC